MSDDKLDLPPEPGEIEDEHLGYTGVVAFAQPGSALDPGTEINDDED